ncbi:MAG: T9SS type A sorting domain-containing protein [Chitinophagales bacterium]|nr:T9SS type A sorting domain-containing protein [Chitinophagales bacterium]
MKGTFTRFLMPLLLVCIIGITTASAQFTTQIGTETTVSTLYGPFYKPSPTNVFDFSRYSYLFTSGELAALDSGSVITKIAFYKANTNKTLIDASLDIYLENVNKTSLLSGVNWATQVIPTATNVLSTTTFQVGDTVGWIMIPVTPFTYTGGDLQVSIDFDISAIDPPVNGGINWRFSTAAGLQTIGDFGSSTPTTLDIVDPTNPNRRPNLLISYSPPPSLDVSVTSFPNFQASQDQGPVSIDVIFKNLGGTIISTVDLYASVTLDGGSTTNFGPVAYSGPSVGINKFSDTVSIGLDTFGTGTYTICAWTQSPNGGIDEDPSNDTLCITVVSIGPKPVPYKEDFETFIVGSPGVLLNDWTSSSETAYQWYVEDATGANENSSGTGPFYDHTNFGSSGGIYMYTESSSGATGDTAMLVSPEIDLSGVSLPVLSFWFHMYGAAMGELHFDINDGTGWVLDFIPFIDSSQQAAGSDPWIEVKDTLTAYLNKTVQIRFRAVRGSTFTSDICIDDFKVSDPTIPDVGIATVYAPSNGCDLSSSELVFVAIKNFGEVVASPPIAVEVQVTGEINSGILTDTITTGINPGGTKFYIFPTQVDLSAYGNYQVAIKIKQNADPNSTNDAAVVSFKNVPSVAIFPYLESFESGSAGWSSSGSGNTWALGVPGHNTIKGASDGTQAWTTGGADTTSLNSVGEAGFYNPNENSYVESPCLNFGALSSIEILMDVWWNSEFSFDGAVLQGSTDFGESWTTVGSFGEPDNWYNDNTINGSPGGSSQGWTGRASTSNGSGGWVTARHDLNIFVGEPEVFLRVAFGADGSVQDDGFGFDNVLIREISLNDVGVVDISTSEGCDLTANEAISLTIKNFASATISGPEDIPLAFQVNGGTVTHDTVTIASLLVAGSQAVFTLNATVDLTTPGENVIKAWTNRDGDGKASNDTISLVFESLLSPPLPTVSGDTVCGGGMATFSASGIGDAFVWYDSAVGGNIVGTDTSLTISISSTTTLYCEATTETNEFVGVIDNTIGGGGFYNSRQGLLLNVNQPVTLKSAFFYPGSAANRTFNVYDENDVLFSSVTVFMDVDARYELNLELPAGTGILIEAETSSNLFRNFSGASYPYVSPSGNVTITGTDNNLAAYYYFFYNMELLIPGCSSSGRSAATSIVPSSIATSIVGTNASSTGASDGSADLTVSGGISPYTYFWSNTATTEDISGISAGTYFVTVTDAVGCTATDQVVIDEPSNCSPSATVTGVTTIDIRLTRAKLVWDVLPGTNTFQVRGKKVTDPSNVNLTVSGTSGQIQATNLSSGATYQWEVRAVCDQAGTVFTPWSGLTQFTTGTCDAPAGLSTTNITQTTATLNWNQIAYNQVIGYRVSGGVCTSFGTSLDIAGKTNTSRNVGGLAANTCFSWTVQAACQDGPGVVVFTNPNTVNVTTFTTPPAPPAKVDVAQLNPSAMIYPNPTQGSFSLKLHDHVGEFSVTILDLSGKEMLRSDVQNRTINVESLAAGYYNVIIKTDTESFTEKLIIVQ